MTIEHSLWVEKYRPASITNDYVFSDDRQKQQFMNWIRNQEVPHLLFSGGPGCGKTAAARALANDLNIDPYDLLFINASRENSVDDMRTRINTFVSTMPFGKMKIVILDEADGLSPSSQGALRGIMEQFSNSSRFFLTCNFASRIIPAIHSRTQSININKLDLNDFTTKMAEILIAENIAFEIEDLDAYVQGTWPDLRKCINNCQQNSIDGKLLSHRTTSATTRDYKIDAISMIKSGQIRAARKLICNQIRPEELEDFLVFCYNNLDLWGQTDEQKDQAILIIRKSMVQIPMAADAEILAAATLIELSQIQ